MAELEWVIIELGPKAEGEDPDLVRASIRHSIRDAEVFIPASITKVGEERVFSYLVEGYAFIKRIHPDATYMRLENTKYVQSVLRHPVSVNGGRPIKRIAVATETDIDKLRSQIRVEVDQGISVGDKVMITSGAYKQIEAIVENEIPELDAIQVHIKLRSVARIITLPRAFLKLLERAQRSPLRDRTDAVRSWFHKARPLMQWVEDDVTHLLVPYPAYVRLADWLLKSREAIAVQRLRLPPEDFTPVQQQYKKSSFLGDVRRRARLALLGSQTDPEHERYMGNAKLFEKIDQIKQLKRFQQQGRVLSITTFSDSALERFVGQESLLGKVTEWSRLSGWVATVKNLDRELETIYSLPPSPEFDARYLEWAWWKTVVERVDALHGSISVIETELRSEGDVGMLQNLIIDGTQLAIRCMMSPGLSDLKDSTGRPTGAIVGFCQSLVSLRKRYPTAAFHVTWDGSSQRRKKMFAGYKASREGRSPLATFEIHFLRNLLPLVGIHQAYNPYEEADDVMATLVRGRLKGQQNAFLTTDRDLLQLVGEKDHQFVPAVGSGKEKLYTVESVTEEYGVGPDRIVEVRALSGDTSDDIPGADGFGLKTASKLVKLYGTLDRLYSSNFAGLTKKQVTNLRAAEKQVRLNLELLKLQDDLDLTLVGPDPDQIAATERLREVNVKPDALLAAFFPDASGLSAHA